MKSTPNPAKQAYYHLMSHLPGRRGLRYLRKHSLSRRDDVNALFDAALVEASGKTCIDLGANMGVFATRMAKHAGRVYAFEPDPWTAQKLRENTAGFDNIEVIEAAAGVETGKMPIYRSAKFDTDPRKGSLSSTLLADKSNVTPETAAMVDVIDFAEFLSGLHSDIAIVKIDIEGGEVALLEHLLDHPVISRIGYIFVETHETKLPRDLVARSRALRRRARQLTHPRIDMDWM
ncbi:FkbM family methyltransferase [Pseudoponticoccus marisrubri]|uniref:Methyltransferase FkbM domain-containing protein n=1 Tax=Pseudoponticoccus marisrubri TaxID=1685382 RepID=A0A0W7WMC3_9RHOB|nr:FkbM family methyltransferase [Pseudoponticoccus marisrubri]KUF11740.1 hypothetical protein AVJ23_03905 [Pseudoponticoccus marisrubri]